MYLDYTYFFIVGDYMRRFVAILGVITVVVVILRMVLAPYNQEAPVDALGIFSSFLSLELPTSDLIAYLVNEYHDSLDLLNFSFQGFKDADGILDLFKSFIYGISAFLNGLVTVIQIPFRTIIYLTGTTYELVRWFTVLIGEIFVP